MKTVYQNAFNRLKQKKAELIAGFLEKKENTLPLEHSRLLDAYFLESFEQSRVGPDMEINKNPYALIALGGYGREEQCICSDVDILFLFKKNVPDAAEGLIQEMIYPLWDMRLDVGHATRSLKECIALASSDFEVLTSLMDARFICGMSLLYSELTAQIRQKILLKKSRRILTWLAEKTTERHRLFGDSTDLLEPNLKEGRGGLRDYQTMLWTAKVKFNLNQPRDLEYQGHLSHDEFVSLTRAADFIRLTRNCLHYFVNRKYDRLHFERQADIAAMLGYETSKAYPRVERFLGDLHGHMEFIKQKHLMFLYEAGAASNWFKIRKRFEKKTMYQGLEIVRGMLGFVSPADILKSPALLMKIFEESARLKIPLSMEAVRVVREFAHLMDAPLRGNGELVQSFERILSTRVPKINVIENMLSAGLLPHFIPPFSDIANRVEYDAFHIHPVDKHMILTVQNIKKFGTSSDPSGEELCGLLYRELHRKKALLWAALLHDIGKKDGTDNHAETGAAIACDILQEKGLSDAEIETAVFLIKEHLFLIHIATRRDINDEETVTHCVRKIRDTTRLKMLYLLTVADSTATGPKAWNEWISVLLRDLFLKVLNVLERGALAFAGALETLEEKEAAVLSSCASIDADMPALIRSMSPRYLLYMDASRISDHVRLYLRLKNDNFVWTVNANHDANIRHLTICAKQIHGMLSKIAGVLTLNSINILETQSFTWSRRVSLTLLTVSPPRDLIFEDDKWQETARKLKMAISGELDISDEIKKTMHRQKPKPPNFGPETGRIVIDNESSSFFSIIEVYAHDFPGLLFGITDCLFQCGLRIHYAQVATRTDQAVDVFYVQDIHGRKIDDLKQSEAVQEAIRQVINQG